MMRLRVTNDFIYQSHPVRVVFASGAIRRVGEEIERIGGKKVLVITSAGAPGRINLDSMQLGERKAGIFDGAIQHTPTEVTELALNSVLKTGADSLLAIGGSSTIGLGKALALRTSLPLTAVPTTYAGSEMTPLLGQTHERIKTTVRDVRVQPKTVIYDVDLTLSLSPAISAASGVNAIAHAIEALYAPDGNPLISLLAEDAVRLMAVALPIIVDHPDDVSARIQALRAAWQSGICLGSVSMGIHHKLCHTLGGMFDLPHAETHCVLLPHAIAYNTPAASPIMRTLACAFGSGRAAEGAYDLLRALGVPTSLRSLGVPESGLDVVARTVLASPFRNPGPVDYAAVRQLLQNAWTGAPPDDHE